MSTTSEDVKAAGGGHAHGPAPYQVHDIACRLVDNNGQLIDEWVDRQELWLEFPNIAVRRTRTLEDGTKIRYEDRGQINPNFSLTGKDGFGGEWSGRAFIADGVVYTEGHGGPVDFWMTNWTISEREQACLRILDVKEPTPWLTKKPLAPGKYWIKTVDSLVETRNEVPEDMKRPMS
jgi:hypothetical protein